MAPRSLFKVSVCGFGWFLMEQNHRLLPSVLTGRQIHHGERCQGCGGHHQWQVACAACQGQGHLSFASGCLCPLVFASFGFWWFEWRWPIQLDAIPVAFECRTCRSVLPQTFNSRLHWQLPNLSQRSLSCKGPVVWYLLQHVTCS